MKADCVKRGVSYAFGRLGYHIGCHPFWYIIVTTLLTTILTTGFYKITLTTDIEYLYSPVNGRARTEKEVVESLFPPSISTDFDLSRLTRFGRFGSLILTPKNNTSVFEESVFDNMLELDENIHKITVQWENRTLNYTDLCSKTIYGKCFENHILSLKGKVTEIKRRKIIIKYPWEVVNGYPTLIGMNLGGVVFDDNYHVQDAEAIRLFYFLDYSTEEKDEIASKWETEFLNKISELQFEHIEVSKFIGQGLDNELNKITEMAYPLLFIAIPVMVIFSALSSLSSDTILSKPWMGVACCLSAAMGAISAFGFLLHCDMEYADLNLAVAFLILGVGIDDSFVFLAAWRRTSPKDTIEKRMSDTFSHAAVSVSITSLTNLAAFCIGLITPYRVVRIFCLYSAMSVLFCYIYQITLFGPCLALDGYREEKKRHCLFCYPKKPKNIDASSSFCYNNNEMSRYEDKMLLFFRDVLGGLLSKKIAKVTVILLFVVYLGVGIYCMRWIKEGLDYNQIFPLTSYVIGYMKVHYQYFTDYPHRIHLVVNKTLDYSDPKVQTDIEDILQRFENTTFIADSFGTESWLRAYLTISQHSQWSFLFNGYNLSDSRDFIVAYKNVFLKFPLAYRFKKDVLFNGEGNQIVASRYIIQSKDIRDSLMEKDLLIKIREVADSTKYPVHVFNMWFIFYDQYLNVIKTCIQTVCITAVSVLVIFVLFIPNISCAVCVMLTIASIEVGVVGYMSVWNVNLDSVVMIILIMCAGFSVDYSAHISYSYVVCKEEDPNEKLKTALYAAGYPAFQGCISTILGVAVLYFGPSYLFVIFFKVMILVMGLAAFHGLLLLPVLLSIKDFVLIMIRNKFKHDKHIRSIELNGGGRNTKGKTDLPIGKDLQIPFIDDS